MQDWLNRLGLTLQFLALWLVTPQIVGEDLMLKAGQSLSAMAKAWADFMQKIRKAVSSLREALMGLLVFLVVTAEILVHIGPTHSVGYWMLVVETFIAGTLTMITLVVGLAALVMSGLSWLSRTSTRSAHGFLIAELLFLQLVSRFSWRQPGSTYSRSSVTSDWRYGLGLIGAPTPSCMVQFMTWQDDCRFTFSDAVA
jgi:hypothetical protein